VAALSGDDGAVPWSHVGPGSVGASPALSSDQSQLLVGDVSGALSAYDTESGRLLWQRANGFNSIRSAINVAPPNDVLFFVDYNVLRATRRTGAAPWEHALRSAAAVSPALTPDFDVLVCGGAGRCAVTARPGSLLWHTLPDHALTSPAISKDGKTAFVLVSPSPYGDAYDFVAAVAVQSGAILWKHPIAKPSFYISVAPALGDSMVYVCGVSNEVIGLDAASGALQWSRRADSLGVNGAPAVDGDGSVFLSAGQDVVVRGGATGDVKWRRRIYPFSFTGVSPAITADGTLIAAASPGTIYPHQGRVLAFRWLWSVFPRIGDIRAPCSIVAAQRWHLERRDRALATAVCGGAERHERDRRTEPARALENGPKLQTATDRRHEGAGARHATAATRRQWHGAGRPGRRAAPGADERCLVLVVGTGYTRYRIESALERPSPRVLTPQRTLCRNSNVTASAKPRPEHHARYDSNAVREHRRAHRNGSDTHQCSHDDHAGASVAKERGRAHFSRPPPRTAQLTNNTCSRGEPERPGRISHHPCTALGAASRPRDQRQRQRNDNPRPRGPRARIRAAAPTPAASVPPDLSPFAVARQSA